MRDRLVSNKCELLRNTPYGVAFSAGGLEPSDIQSQTLRKFIAGVILAALASLSFAADPLPAEPDFSPPPVPGFMLRKPDKPLTIEEMRRQADEAATRVRAGRGSSTPQPSPAGGTQEEVNIHKP